MLNHKYIDLMSSIKTFLEQRPICPIYHYANANAAINIVRDKKIWASHIRHLNDSAEFVNARNWINEKLKKWGKAQRAQAALAGVQVDPSDPLRGTVGQVSHAFGNSGAPVFIASFSEAANLLSQWRGYCPHGDGYSLGFDASRFKGSPSMRLVRCVYKHADVDEHCTSLLESWADEPERVNEHNFIELLGDCMAIMAAIKDESFAEECEWRLVTLQIGHETRWRTGRHGIVPYVELPFGADSELQLNQVWLGPNSDMQAAKEAFRDLAAKHGFGHIPVHESKIPFRG